MANFNQFSFFLPQKQERYPVYMNWSYEAMPQYQQPLLADQLLDQLYEQQSLTYLRQVQRSFWERATLEVQVAVENEILQVQSEGATPVAGSPHYEGDQSESSPSTIDLDDSVEIVRVLTKVQIDLTEDEVVAGSSSAEVKPQPRTRKKNLSWLKNSGNIEKDARANSAHLSLKADMEKGKLQFLKERERRKEGTKKTRGRTQQSSKYKCKGILGKRRKNKEGENGASPPSRRTCSSEKETVEPHSSTPSLLPST